MKHKLTVYVSKDLIEFAHKNKINISKAVEAKLLQLLIEKEMMEKK